MKPNDNCEALEQMNARLTTGLVNIYHVITGEQCKHGVALGMATSAVSSLKSENAALREQLAQAHSDNERLARVIQGIEEREAAVCPEDVGFDEYIRTLQRKLETRPPQAGYPWTGNEP